MKISSFPELEVRQKPEAEDDPTDETPNVNVFADIDELLPKPKSIVEAPVIVDKKNKN